MKMLDTIDTGALRVKGAFDIVVTDDASGEIVQEVHMSNTLTAAAYEQMKLVLLDAMTIYDADGYPRPFIYGSENSGSQYARAVAPFNNIYLTDGENAAGYVDPYSGFDGLVKAVGTGSYAAQAAGTAYGQINTSACYVTNNKAYKRWDWASTNGVGTFRKVYLGKRADKKLKTSGGANDLFFPTAIGTVAPSGYTVAIAPPDNTGIYHFNTADRRSIAPGAAFNVAKSTFNGTSFDTEIVTFYPNQSTSNYFSFNTDYNISIFQLPGSNQLFVFSHNGACYMLLDFSTGATISYGVSTTPAGSKSTFSPFMYPDGTPGLFTFDNSTMYEYRLDMSSGFNFVLQNTVNLWYKDPYTGNSIALRYYSNQGSALLSGNSIYLMSGTRFYKINRQTGQYAYVLNERSLYVESLPLGDDTTYSLWPMIYNGHRYIINYSNRVGSAYFRLVEISLDDMGLDAFFSTEQVLPTPITKTSAQSMYVGYTLEFI